VELVEVPLNGRVADDTGTVHAVHVETLAVMVNEANLGVYTLDAQMRPDRFADVMNSRLEDLVRTHHALGPNATEVLGALDRSHRHKIRLAPRRCSPNLSFDGRLFQRESGRVEKGTLELKPNTEGSFERPRQLSPVGWFMRQEELVNVTENDVPT